MNVTSLDFLSKLLSKRHAIVFWMAAALGALLYVSGAGEGLDRLLRDARDAVRSHSASGEIQIVEMDAKSMRAIGKWPWPRSVHAAAVDRLNQAGARSIAFDVDFSALSNPRDDATLSRALERARGGVILPALRQSASSESSLQIESVPAKQFSDHAFLASVNVVPDADGYVRQVPLGLTIAGVPRPSLPAMLAERQAETGRYFDIDYSIDPASIPRHSFIDLIEGRIPKSELAGKRVVIGATAIELGDRYGVPSHGVIPGVVIQALGAETLMEGPVPQRFRGLALMLAIVLVGAVTRGGSRPRRIALFALGSTAIMALPLVTESLFAISFTVAPALAALGCATLLAGLAFFGERYREKALADGDTGLPNLAALQIAVGEREDISIVVARIDRFAAIAAGLGPAATANMMLRVADRLRYANFEFDIYRTEEAALAWIEEKGRDATLEERFAAIASVMRSPVDCGRLVDVSLNFGIADGSGAEARHLTANASLAAHHAAQKNVRWERFSDGDSDETNWHLSLLGELDAAMTQGHVWNAYQPKLDLKSGRIVAVEALVRWQHPERGPIGPDHFIPLVEEHGRARDLTSHVLEQAMDDAWHWKEAGREIGVAVNVSANLLADHEFIEIVGQRLRQSPLPTNRVTIEVTESAAMDSPERAIAALESWRALGVNISIDDYGTGQSSLGYLQKLPATELKIDKSFVQTIVSDSRNAIMVRSTIALAHELGMKVVAEGIEDEDCLALLRDMGCDTGQGYHIGAPMSAETFIEFLAEREKAAA